MKINVVAVGKIKEKYFNDAIAEYAKRLSTFCDFKIAECPEYPPKTQSAADVAKSKNDEGAAILEKMKGFAVATAINGESVSSEGLAEFIAKKSVGGCGEITFVIGGSNGLSDEVLKRADMKISFGKITLPHQLMRVVLSEQLYRAFAINNRLPYHK